MLEEFHDKDAIECFPVKGNFFVPEDSMIDFDPRCGDLPLEPSVHSGAWLNGRDLTDLGRVVRQVKAGAYPDLQDVTIDSRQLFLAIPCPMRSIDQPVVKARKNDVGVEAQPRLLRMFRLIFTADTLSAEQIALRVLRK